MKGLIIFAILLAVLGGAALLYAIVGKIIQKMFSKKGNK